jgi:hypothetical protein
MVAANLFDHPGLILIIVAVTLIRWLAQKAKSGNQNTQPPAPPSRPIPRGGESQTEEERIRKFLEALGQPPGSTPPKVAPRRREVQPRIFPKVPPLTTAPPPLSQSPATRPSMPPPPMEVAPFKPAIAPEGDFEVHEVARQISSEPVPEIRRELSSRQNLRAKFATRSDLRDAIVLREIFGPPRSVQPLDSLLGF